VRVNRRRAVLIAFFALASVGVLGWLALGSDAGEENAPAVGALASKSDQSVTHSVAGELTTAQMHPGSKPAVAEAGTPLEIEVTANGKPQRAEVRVFTVSGIGPNELEWKEANSGETNERGRTVLFVSTGQHAVLAHAPGYAPRSELVSVGTVPVHFRLALGQASTITGRVLKKGTREPIPMAEVMLTPYLGKPTPLQKAAAPAEARVYATSDEHGRFRLEPVSSGLYCLEALVRSSTAVRKFVP
jgi:hypothetical protein